MANNRLHGCLIRSRGSFRSLILLHLSWPHLIQTECAVTGRSHGEPGRFTAHDPQFAVAVTNHSVLS